MAVHHLSHNAGVGHHYGVRNAVYAVGRPWIGRVQGNSCIDLCGIAVCWACKGAIDALIHVFGVGICTVCYAKKKDRERKLMYVHCNRSPECSGHIPTVRRDEGAQQLSRELPFPPCSDYARTIAGAEATNDVLNERNTLREMLAYWPAMT